MKKIIVLYNPVSCNGKGEEKARKLTDIITDNELEFVNITYVNYSEFFKNIPSNADIILCGGDGTINRFINDTRELSFENKIFYYACGTGNDFLKDINIELGSKPVEITKYLKNLPTVKVKGKDYLFLNNVGFGIDGYCCQVGDELRAQHEENINYAGIAIKGLLGKFHPQDAIVTVDGVEHTFKKAWLAPTLKGRYYGGGMMPAPMQDRMDPDKSLSVMLFYGKGKLKTLMAFPSIFKGEHIKHKNMVVILKGHNIKVQFAKPCALQIDGETILDVTEYEVHA